LKEKIIAEKKDFVNKLSEALTADSSNHVRTLHYETRCIDNVIVEETVYILYRGGYERPVCVTCCSLGSIARTIIREIYGDELPEE